MTFFAFGLNHEQASVSTREAFALDDDVTRSLYRGLRLSPDAEIICLSTCNRTEVYLYGSFGDVEQIKERLSVCAEAPWPEEAAFYHEDEAAIRHILQVASGLRSQVLGDNQILSQVKEAYSLAVEEDRVDTVMHRLMHTAFRTAKRVVTETGVAEGAASISAVAVSAVQNHFGRASDSLADRDILLLGAGEMGQGVLYMLNSYAVGRLVIANRSSQRANKLAAEVGAEVMAWESRYEEIDTYDAVIVATGASEAVLTADRMPEKTSDASTTLLVDIALPRNIDPTIDGLSGYARIDLDTLGERMARTEDKRGAELPAARQICEEELGEFVSWVFYQQALQPAIETLRQTFEAIRRKEIERHHSRFNAVDREELDRITRSIMQKLLAVPIVRLKDAADNDLDLAQRVELLHTLFAQSDADDSSSVNEMDECPYLRDHMEENQMWRPVANYMRKLAGTTGEESAESTP